MNLEMFQYIDEIIEVYKSKQGVYKLIADEIQGYFEKHVFDKSPFTFNIIYRIKTIDSIKEKLLRNSYISQYRSGERVLENFSDLIGLRIECKFIDDEPYVYNLLLKVFSCTDDGVYYYSPGMPQIKLNLKDHQPQKQKNGFDIYKMDGRYELGGNSVRFELQIKALVNSFWGEVEHKIIYKNNSYLLADSLISDLMTSIKKSLTMIDSQLYVLYKRFRREQEINEQNDTAFNIERFISKAVYDEFTELMQEQIGFAIDFKESCDTIIRYILEKNNATDFGGCSRMMLTIIENLNKIKEDGTRLDKQIELGQVIYADYFSKTLLATIRSLININYKWHIYFLLLAKLENKTPVDSICEYIAIFRSYLLSIPALNALSKYKEYEEICIKVIDTVATVINEEQKVEFLSNSWKARFTEKISNVATIIDYRLSDGEEWEEIGENLIEKLKISLSFSQYIA